MKRGQRQENKRERPITARPKGRTFYVKTRDLHHRRPARLLESGNDVDVSDNFLEHDSGCFRAEPTCKD